jgi:predicted GH43/DUF377 family glycosyl hydrolase
VLKEDDGYRMWLSWRPKKSVALVESKDGIHWSEPPQIVLGPRKENGWEDVINRPVVVKRGDGYQMWFTSPDGLAWTKHAANPIFAPEPQHPWEQHKVTAGQVEKRGDWHVMFYIGFQNKGTVGYASLAARMESRSGSVIRPTRSSGGEGEVGSRCLLQTLRHLRRDEMAAVV